MNDEPAHPIADAQSHAPATGDGSRAALPALPAAKRTLRRRIEVKSRAPFLPDHHGHARHALIPGEQE